MSARAALVALVFGAGCSRSKHVEPPPAADASAPVVQAKLAPVVATASFGETGLKKADHGSAVLHAASIAKPIVATAVMQVVEDGLVSLDDDVSRHLPFAVKHPKHGAPVTLRLLLRHRASIRDDYTRLQPLRRDQEANGLAIAGMSPFLRTWLGDERGWLPEAPGTTTKYSNVGFALAALVVEHVTKTPFAERCTEKIFAPLSMRATSWGEPRGPHELPHVRVADGGFEPKPQGMRLVYPSVDLWSSPVDLARFGRAILRGGEVDGARVLRAESVATMLDEELGWQTRTLGKHPVVGHEGEDGGASTGLFLDRTAHTGAVVLTNADAFASGDAQRAAALATLLEGLL